MMDIFLQESVNPPPSFAGCLKHEAGQAGAGVGVTVPSCVPVQVESTLAASPPSSGAVDEGFVLAVLLRRPMVGDSLCDAMGKCGVSGTRSTRLSRGACWSSSWARVVLKSFSGLGLQAPSSL